MALLKATKENTQMASRLRDVREELFGPRGGVKMANFLGVAQPAYQQYESAKVRLPHRLMALLADKKRVNLTWLLTGRGNKFLNDGTRPSVVAETEAAYGERAVEVPVFESVGAGDPREINALEPARHLLLDPALTTPGMVALRVRGNSMEASIPEGSAVGVDARNRNLQDLQNRKIYVLWVQDEGFVLRRFYRAADGKGLSFTPDNPAENNRAYTYIYDRKTRRLTEEPHIQGRVEWVLTELNK